MHNSQYNQEQETFTAGNSGSGNLLYLLAGCGIGATLALLFAPKAGSELRTDITAITRQGYDETVDLAHELKERSAELYQSVRQSADRVYDVAATRLHLAQKTIENAGQTPGEIVNGEIGRKGGRSSQNRTETPADNF